MESELFEYPYSDVKCSIGGNSVADRLNTNRTASPVKKIQANATKGGVPVTRISVHNYARHTELVQSCVNGRPTQQPLVLDL
jgi:hypothetical protein